MLSVGQSAPHFELDSTSGKRVSLSDLRGRKAVLYFYPKDDTPGCTREACDFRDRIDRVVASGAQVLGVSSDNLNSHGKFRAKYSLPFDLLADPGNQVASAYGAYGERERNGAMSVGSIRSTFVIDENGRVAAVWSPVKVDGHADEVLAALNATGAAAGSKAPSSEAEVPAPRPVSPRRESTKSPSKPSTPDAAAKSAPKSSKTSASAAPKRASKPAPVAKQLARKPAKAGKAPASAKARANATPARAPKKGAARKLKVVTLQPASKAKSKTPPSTNGKGASAVRGKVIRKGR